MSGSSPQTVSFQNIPTNIRVPLFYAEIRPAQSLANQQTQRVLVVGGTLSTVPLLPVFMPPPSGTGAQGAAQAAAAQFGKGSMLAEMMGSYRTNDGFTEVWVLPVPDPSGGAAATATIVISGTATASGTLNVELGDYLIQQGVTSGQTATAIATALAATINALSGAPVTATASTGTVTLTTRHKLIAMNNLSLMLNYLGTTGGQSTPAGLTVSTSAFTGGTGIPVLTGMAAALGQMDFDFVISGYTDATSLAAMTAMMSDASGRWCYLDQLYGGVWAADVDTFSNLLTLGGTVNDQHQLIWGAYGTPTAPWKATAFATAACVPRIVAQPNLPLQQIAIPGILAPPVGDFPSVSTQQSMLTNGISILSWDRTGMCRIVRAVTTYQTNSFGVADQSYMDVGTPYTLMAVLRQLKGLVTTRYANVLLVPDGTPIGVGVPAVSPRTIKADLIAEYNTMQDAGLVQNAAGFAAGLVVTINANDPTRVDVLWDPSITPGLAIFAAAVQFYLGSAANSNASAAAAA